MENENEFNKCNIECLLAASLLCTVSFGFSTFGIPIHTLMALMDTYQRIGILKLLLGMFGVT